MDDDLAAQLVDFDQHHLGDPVDRLTFMKLVVTTVLLPVLALLAGGMWLR
ncbi:hypothetical protein [Mycobacterium sp. DL99]|nr:hypothetical protein [Mycobacterium sp. DL99]